MFDTYLSEIMLKKNEKKRKSKQNTFDNNKSYSVVNLVRV